MCSSNMQFDLEIIYMNPAAVLTMRNGAEKS